MNSKRELADCTQAPSPHPPGGRHVTARAGRQGALSTKLQASSQLLTKSSWDPGWLTSTRRVTSRDQLPRGAHSTPETALLLCTQETEQLGTGVIRCTVHLGQCAHQVPGGRSSSDRGRVQNTGPTESVLCGVPKNLNLSSLDLESAHNPGPALDSSPSEQPGA